MFDQIFPAFARFSPPQAERTAQKTLKFGKIDRRSNSNTIIFYTFIKIMSSRKVDFFEIDRFGGVLFFKSVDKLF